MPRKNLNMVLEGQIGGQFKVRKRGSTLSSSSLVKNNRLKCAILVGKRKGSSTLMTMWKMSPRSPSLQTEKSFKYLAAKGGDRGKELSVSARKLAATLWEINGVPTPKRKDTLEDKRSEVELVRKGRILKASILSSMALQLYDPSHYPVSERMGQSKEGCHRRRASVGSQNLLLSEFHVEGSGLLQNDSKLEVDQELPHGQTLSRHMAGVKKRLKGVRNGLDASIELLKVLNRTWGIKEQNSTWSSLFSVLKAELDRAFVQVNKLIQRQSLNRAEIEHLLKHFAEEKAVWEIKQQDKIQSAIMSIAGELEIERKLRRQAERLNKKLGRELSDTKASLSRTMKELESEKRARKTLEQVSDELARGIIGEDRTKVEELRRQSAKVREEVEKEREMLQLADMLGKERLQMKLSEAKYEFEDKNAIADKLRSELEAYLKNNVGKEQSYGSPNFDRIKELRKYLRETLPNTYQYRDKDKEDRIVVYRDEQGAEDDSNDSDLCSIELNMDDKSKSYEWYGAVQNGSERKSVDEKHKRSRSTSEKFQRQNVSLERITSDGIEFEFSPRRHENSDILDRSRLFELSSEVLGKDRDDEIERYNMIKDLRDHMVSSAVSMV